MSRVYKRTFAIIMALVLGGAEAALAEAPYCASKDPATTEKFNRLLQDLVKYPERYPSVDAFLGKVPEEMKGFFLLMADSRSLQKATPQNPRVIVSSKNADVVLSFNTDPKLAGYSTVEIIQWNAEKKRFDFKEIEFKKEGGREKPQLTENPAKCVQCHRQTLRPNWDDANIWPGLIGVNDTLIPGMQEDDWYFENLRKIEAKSPRYKHLRPYFKSEHHPRKKRPTPGGAFANVRLVDGQPEILPAFRLLDRFAEKNLCKMLSSLTQHSSFPRIRYALAGAVRGCAEGDEFLPPSEIEARNAYFLNQGVDRRRGADGETSLTGALQENALKLIDDTQRRNEKIHEERLRPYTKRELIIQPLFMEQVQYAARWTGTLRLLLEPEGFPLQDYSMSILPGTYSFGGNERMSELIAHLERDPFFLAIEKERKEAKVPEEEACQWLKKRSLAAFEEGTKPSQKSEPVCGPASDTPLTALRPIRSILQRQVDELVSKKCATCHGSSGFAPPLPLSSAEDLGKGLQKNPQLGHKIVDRIGRPAHDPNLMPMGGPALSGEDQELLKFWIDEVKSVQ